jgi:hypothetical protein
MVPSKNIPFKGFSQFVEEQNGSVSWQIRRLWNRC